MRLQGAAETYQGNESVATSAATPSEGCGTVLELDGHHCCGWVQNMRLAWEEPFGPVLPLIRVKTVEEAIDHCNANNLALQVRAPAFTVGLVQLIS